MDLKIHDHLQSSTTAVSVREAENLSDESDLSSEDKSGESQYIIRKLVIISGICVLFMIIEIIGGYIADSIAILSDALHLLSDLSGFVISIVSLLISRKSADQAHSYGYHRAGVIGALVNVMMIWALTGVLLYQAVWRIIHIDEIEVQGDVMFWTALFGLGCNLVMVKVLHGQDGGGHHNCSHGHGHGGHSHNHGHELKHTSPQKKVCDHNHAGHDHGHGHGNEKAHVHAHGECNGHGHGHGPHKHENGHHHHEHANGHKCSHDHEGGHNHAKHDHKHDHKHEIKNDSEHVLFLTPGKASSLKSLFKGKNDAGLDIELTHDLSEDLASPVSEHDLSEIAQKNLNMRAAFIHILGDILQSIGVIIASLFIWLGSPGAKIADPICTFIFSVLVVFTTAGVTKECVRILMEGTPFDINVTEFENKLKLVSGAREVSNLHIWSLSQGKKMVSVHLKSENPDITLSKAKQLCRRYKIHQSTIQVERF
jgi:zinc transporter 2